MKQLQSDLLESCDPLIDRISRSSIKNGSPELCEVLVLAAFNTGKASALLPVSKNGPYNWRSCEFVARDIVDDEIKDRKV
jgi:hypothetical protein